MTPIELVVVSLFATVIAAAVFNFAKGILGGVFKLLPHVARGLVAVSATVPVAFKATRSAMQSRQAKHFVRSLRKLSIVVAAKTHSLLITKRATAEVEQPIVVDPAWAEYETPAYIRKGRVLSF